MHTPDTYHHLLPSHRILFLFLLLLGASLGTLHAQTIKFEIDSPLVFAPGERFQIKFTLSSSGKLGQSRFTPPTFGSGLRILSGPTLSHEWQSIQKDSIQQIFTSDIYSYIVQADSSQTIKISLANITVDGKRYTTVPITLERRDPPIPPPQTPETPETASDIKTYTL